jgi:hypothetical protein
MAAESRYRFVTKLALNVFPYDSGLCKFLFRPHQTITFAGVHANSVLSGVLSGKNLYPVKC